MNRGHHNNSSDCNNALEALKQYTTVVADTGDFHAMAAFMPQDATTNPSLILKAAQKPEYNGFLSEVKSRLSKAPLAEQMDALIVEFGLRILSIIPGRVSTEVDARLSFDTQATVQRAQRLIDMYRAAGVNSDRVLIKIAATWEGIAAAYQLEKLGIHCNLTLLFSAVQAQACSQAGVRLISPFVGRIYDWAKKQAGNQWNDLAMLGDKDPGVQSVRAIYADFKRRGVATEIMGASFRNVEQILALVGCDLLTISPDLLAQLAQMPAAAVQLVLTPQWAALQMPLALDCSESAFRFAMNADAMATEKLSEGIRSFAADAAKLELLWQSV
jgi:transaldolase